MNCVKLNSRRLKALRKDPVYEAVMTDLVLVGAMDRNIVEGLLGHAISELLIHPQGTTYGKPPASVIPAAAVPVVKPGAVA